MARESGRALLEVDDLSVAHGPVRALRHVDLDIRRGEIVAVLGPNGAGKSTLLATIAGVLTPMTGEVRLGGSRLDRLAPEDVVRRGVALVPEGRRVFPRFTVDENLQIGAFAKRERFADVRDRVLELFPILAERSRQTAGTLSGGEQQQLAIARAMMSEPTLLLLDEPSLGLAPIVVERVFELIARLRAEGVTILLVEQNVHRALEIADRASILSVGRVVLAGRGEELQRQENALGRTYLGIGTA